MKHAHMHTIVGEVAQHEGFIFSFRIIKIKSFMEILVRDIDFALHSNVVDVLIIKGS